MRFATVFVRVERRRRSAWSRSTTHTAPPALAIDHGRKPGVRMAASSLPAGVRRSTRALSRHASQSDPAAAASAFWGYGIAVVRQAGPTWAPASGGGAPPAAGTAQSRRNAATARRRGMADRYHGSVTHEYGRSVVRITVPP